MNIGIDIRTLSFRRGGISQYTYNLLKNMLRIDSANTYYLFNYNKSPYEWDNFRGNIKEIILRLPQRYGLRMTWENILVPMALRKYGIDVWFSPDFYIPKLLRIKSVITVVILFLSDFMILKETRRLPRYLKKWSSLQGAPSRSLPSALLPAARSWKDTR